MLPQTEARPLCEALAVVLCAVNPARILGADFRQATQRFARLAHAPVTMLFLAASDAEELLAECDAVWHALDPSIVHDAELAAAVERFRQFRHLVGRACSAPRLSTVQPRCQEAA